MNAHNGVNMVCIPDEVLSDNSDGDIVDFSGSGKIVEQDGKKYISIHQINGSDVTEMDDAEKESSLEDEGDISEMDSNDALNSFMSKRNKKVHPGMGESYPSE